MGHYLVIQTNIDTQISSQDVKSGLNNKDFFIKTCCTFIENTSNLRVVLYFPSDITKDFGFVSVSLCHVVFTISNVNIYTT